MNYIIDNVKKLEEDTLVDKAYLASEHTISYYSTDLNRMNYIRMDMSGFILTPGKVIVDKTLLETKTYPIFKEQMLQLLNQGCTTVIVFCEGYYEKQLMKDLKRAKHKMINSTIDYMIGLQIPLNKLTPTIVRLCKKEFAPIISATFSTTEEIDSVHWQRIREAMFPLQIPIIPNYQPNENDTSKRKQNKILKYWNKMMAKYRIPTVSSFPDHHESLSKDQLKIVGLYPKKGELLIGSDVDYLLYEAASVAQFEEVRYDSNNPNLVVLRGHILKAGDQHFFKPGFGKEVEVSVPSHFTPISEAHQYGL